MKTLAEIYELDAKMDKQITPVTSVAYCGLGKTPLYHDILDNHREMIARVFPQNPDAESDTLAAHITNCVNTYPDMIHHLKAQEAEIAGLKASNDFLEKCRAEWAARAIKQEAEIVDLRSIFKRCVDIIAFHNGGDDEKIEAIRKTMLQAPHLSEQALKESV